MMYGDEKWDRVSLINTFTIAMTLSEVNVNAAVIWSKMRMIEEAAEGVTCLV